MANDFYIEKKKEIHAVVVTTGAHVVVDCVVAGDAPNN